MAENGQFLHYLESTGGESLKQIDIKAIETDKAPAPVGPYSQAIQAGNFLFVSGLTGTNPETGKLHGETVRKQAEQSLKNLGCILKEAGASYESVVKTTCFLADMKDFQEFNEVYAEFLTGKPARSCVAVKTLPMNALCEVEAIAYIE